MNLAHDALARAFDLFSQDNRAVRLRLAGRRGQGFEGLLVPQVAAIDEAVCGGLTVRVTCVSPRADLPRDELLGLPIEVQLVTDVGGLRRFCAIVTDVRQGQSDGALTAVQLTACDAFAVMERQCSERVFLGKSALDVVRIVFDGWRRRFPALANAFDYTLLDIDESAYPVRDFTFQVGQSDGEFVRGLLKRHGLAWYFRPGEGGESQTAAHQLVLFDNSGRLQENGAGAVRYHRGEGTPRRDTLSHLTLVHTLASGAVRRADWDHETARVDVASEARSIEQGGTGNELGGVLEDARIQLPHAGDSWVDRQRLARLHLQRHEYRAKCLHGAGDVRAQAVGEWNRIEGHPGLDTQTQEEREYVTVELQHRACNNLPRDLDERVQALLAASAHGAGWVAAAPVPAGEPRYGNTFTAVRRDVPIVPAWDPHTDLPRLPTLTAVVVGPPGEAVLCDRLGRVKVRFLGLDPADHAHAGGAGTNGHDSVSAWVRVDFGWAGESFGVLFPLRAGMEVDVRLDDPDHPVITGCRYNARNLPPSFSNVGSLPGNRALSGIVTREIGGSRYQQLRFDDTPGQISVQLASEHGHSQISLGQLHHPRQDGRAEPRGQGGELRSDGPVAVRGGQGVLVTSHAQPQAGGHQLARAELLGLVQSLQAVAEQLGELAGTHQAGQTDVERLQQLNVHLADWDQGASATPVVAVSAAAGAALASQDNVFIGAQTNLDAVSAGHTQLNAGRHLLLRSGALMAAFADAAMKLIAKLDVSIESHTANVALKAAKNIELIAGAKITLQAPEIEVISQGAATKWSAGSIVEQASGPFVVKSAGFAQSSGGDGLPEQVTLPGTKVQHDQRVVLRWWGTGEPMPHRRYRITTEGGQVIEGRSDAQGQTEPFSSDIAYGHYTIEPLDD